MAPPSAPTNPDHDLRQRMRRIDDLIKEVEHFKDPQARAKTREIIQVLMEFHGAAVERMLENLAATGQPGLDTIDAMSRDELVASLLLLYGLHPLDLQTRVAQALEKVRPFLHTHGGNVELLGVDDAVVRLRLQGSCHGCPSSAQTLKQTIEEAIFAAAPDIAAIQLADEMVEAPPAPPEAPESPEPGRFSLPILAAK